MARGRKKQTQRTYKQPNGYGSVYMLKDGNRRKPYVVSVTEGWDIVEVNGKMKKKQKRRIIDYAISYEEGNDILCEYHKKKNAGIEILTNHSTFKELFDIVIERHTDGKSAQLKNAYFAAFKLMSDIHNIPISAIRAGTMQNQIDKAYKNKKRSSTLNNMKIVCRLIFEYADQNDLIVKNYSSFLKIPKTDKMSNKKPFTEDEILALWKCKLPLSDTILILIYTGMRINEMLKLKKEDVHPDDRYIITGSKTDVGKNRIIPIPHPIHNIIKKYYDSSITFLLELDGKQISDQTYRKKYWDIVMNNLEMEHTPHECRHTYCTLTDYAGMNRVTQQTIVGHKGKNVTEQVYIHKDVQHLIDAVDAIWPTCVSYLLATKEKLDQIQYNQN